MTSAGRSLPDDSDVIVVGGGAGGLTAAAQAARFGARTVLVADGPLGGDCTHTGCIPSKTLIAAAAEGRDFAAAMDDVRATVSRVAATEDEATLTRAGVTVVRGRAALRGPGRVEVDGRELRARHVLIATGATASVPPVPGLRDIGVLTNATVFDLTSLPARLTVVGGGPIGCELAQAFARLGSRVTVIDLADRLLPNEEPEASAVVARALVADGIELRLGHGLSAAEHRGRDRVVRLDDGTEVVADEVLVTTGRRPVTEGLGLAEVGVRLGPGGHIEVDDRCATNIPGVWAVGDVTPLGGFTHVAGHMGFVAARNATRSSRLRPAAKVDRRVVPRVTFTDPEVASVGLTEAEAVDRGGRVAEVPLERVDRALTTGRTEGFVKLIAGPRPVLRSLGGGELLGATIVGPTAGELVGEVALAMRTRMFTGRLAQTIHAYPTWSMAIQQAATQFFFATDGVEARPAQRSGTDD